MKFSNEDTGSVMIMVAIAMIVFLGFSALAIDGGNLYFKKTELQGIADAAALAGGKEYNGTDQTSAILKAVDYARKNNLTVTYPDPAGSYTAVIENANGETGYMDVSFPSNNVKVVMNLACENYFAKILGSDSSDVAVAATAGRGNLAVYNGENLVPIGVENREFVQNQEYNLTYGPGEGFSGNYGYVNLDTYLPPGAEETNTDKSVTNFSTYLLNGYTGDTQFEVGGTVYTVTGIGEGHVKPAFNPSILPRTVIVPIIESLGTMSGTSERITIIGFAKFEITDYIKNPNKRDDLTEEEKNLDKIIVGVFKEMILTGSGSAEESPYLAQAVRLIE